MSAASAADASLRQLADLPYPRGLPLLGNLLQLPPRQFHLVLERWARELGTPFRFRIGATPMTVWDDPDVCQTVMRQRPHLYRRYASLEPVFDEIGCKGLFFVEGKRWEPQRKLAVQALSMPHIKTLYPMVAAITERLRLRWQRAGTWQRFK